MKYKRLIYIAVFLLLLVIAGYCIFTGCQVGEVSEVNIS